MRSLEVPSVRRSEERRDGAETHEEFDKVHALARFTAARVSEPLSLPEISDCWRRFRPVKSCCVVYEAALVMLELHRCY